MILILLLYVNIITASVFASKYVAYNMVCNNKIDKYCFCNKFKQCAILYAIDDNYIHLMIASVTMLLHISYISYRKYSSRKFI